MKLVSTSSAVSGNQGTKRGWQDEQGHKHALQVYLRAIRASNARQCKGNYLLGHRYPGLQRGAGEWRHYRLAIVGWEEGKNVEA